MSGLKKITVSDKVSSWIEVVNAIVDKFILAVAPVNDKGGNDGLLSSADKKKLDDLSQTYMPINGEMPVGTLWMDATPLESSDAFYLTYESKSLIVYNNYNDLEITVVAGKPTIYSEKLLYLLNAETPYTVTINYETETKKYEVTDTPVVLKVSFVAGMVIFSELNQ